MAFGCKPPSVRDAPRTYPTLLHTVALVIRSSFLLASYLRLSACMSWTMPCFSPANTPATLPSGLRQSFLSPQHACHASALSYGTLPLLDTTRSHVAWLAAALTNCISGFAKYYLQPRAPTTLISGDCTSRSAIQEHAVCSLLLLPSREVDPVPLTWAHDLEIGPFFFPVSDFAATYRVSPCPTKLPMRSPL